MIEMSVREEQGESFFFKLWSKETPYGQALGQQVAGDCPISRHHQSRTYLLTPAAGALGHTQGWTGVRGEWMGIFLG